MIKFNLSIFLEFYVHRREIIAKLRNLNKRNTQISAINSAGANKFGTGTD